MANRAYGNGNFAMKLDGVSCGIMKSAGGLNISAEVIEEPVAGGLFTHKHVSLPKYDDLKVVVGITQSKAISDWISQTWALNFQPKTGHLSAYDFSLKEVARKEFFGMYLAKIGIGACDGASKEALNVTITGTPETVRYKKGDGSKPDISVNIG